MSSACSNALSECSEKSVGTRTLVGLSIVITSFQQSLSNIIIATSAIFGRIFDPYDSEDLEIEDRQSK
jgi:hypothetical protein